jgi:hypothetical protein
MAQRLHGNGMTRQNLSDTMKPITNRLVLMDGLLIGACLIQWRLLVIPSQWMTPSLLLAQVGVAFYALLLLGRIWKQANQTKLHSPPQEQ